LQVGSAAGDSARESQPEVGARQVDRILAIAPPCDQSSGGRSLIRFQSHDRTVGHSPFTVAALEPINVPDVRVERRRRGTCRFPLR
jgi:hypothetical protein